MLNGIKRFSSICGPVHSAVRYFYLFNKLGLHVFKYSRISIISVFMYLFPGVLSCDHVLASPKNFTH